MIDFVLLTTPKTGSTALFNYLKNHSRICMPPQKELFFWDTNFYKGFNWYKDKYNHCLNNQIKGEICTHGLVKEEYYEKIIKINKEIKIIILLRSPIERVFSHYYHNKRIGIENLSLTNAIETEELRIKDLPITSFGYVKIGLISLDICEKIYKQNNNIIFITQKELLNEPKMTLKKICKFLNIKYDERPLMLENFNRKDKIKFINKIVKLTQSTLSFLETNYFLKRFIPLILKQKTRIFRARIYQNLNKLIEFNSTKLKSEPIKDLNLEKKFGLVSRW